jgi:hypothetical protein
VIVYIVSRNPAGRTYHQYMLIANPELLIRSVKTKSTLWWRSGTMTRIAMITSTPTTCQKTEMVLNRATRCEE